MQASRLLKVKVKLFVKVCCATIFLGGWGVSYAIPWSTYKATHPGTGPGGFWQSGDDMTVPAGTSVEYDDADGEIFGDITINGKFYCANPINGDYGDTTLERQMTVKSIMVSGAGARFECGNETDNFQGKYFKIYTEESSTNICVTQPKKPICQGIMVEEDAELSLFGDIHHNTWTQMASTATPGTNTITVLDASGWKIGDEITIAPSNFEGSVSGMSSEDLVQDFVITGVSGNVLTLDANLDSALKVLGDAPYDYGNDVTYKYGDPLTAGTLAYRYTQELTVGGVELKDQDGNSLLDRILDKEGDNLVLNERAEVVNKTRNIQIIGANDPTNNRGAHMMFMASAGSVKIDGIEVKYGGRMAFLGRYPIHWHRAGGVSTSRSGDYLRNSSIHNAYNRCLTLHGVDDIIVEKNVCVNTFGHAYFLEDGDEDGHLFIDNIAILAKAPPENMELLHSDGKIDNPGTGGVTGPALYWITNPDNIFIGNAASSAGSGYWFAFKDAVHNVAGTPAPVDLPFSVFSGNRVHNTIGGVVMDSFPNGECRNNPRNLCDPDGTATADEINRQGDHALMTLEGQRYTGAGQAEFIMMDDITSYKAKSFAQWIFGGNAITTTNMILADSLVNVGVVHTQDITNSLVVGASPALSAAEINSRLDDSTIKEQEFNGALMYDGPEKFKDIHFAGFGDTSKSTIPLAIFGGSDYRPVHQGENITFEDSGIVRLDFFHYEFKPRHRDNWTTGFYDNDGSVIGLSDYTIRPDEESTTVDDISSFISTDPADSDCYTPAELEALNGIKIKNATVCPGRFGIISTGSIWYSSLKRVSHNPNYPDVNYNPLNSPAGDGDIRQFAYPNNLIKVNQPGSTKSASDTDDLTYEMNFREDEFKEDKSFSLYPAQLDNGEWSPWFVLSPKPHQTCVVTSNISGRSDVIVTVDNSGVSGVDHDLHVRMKMTALDDHASGAKIAIGPDRSSFYSYPTDDTDPSAGYGVFVRCGFDTDRDGILNSDPLETDDDNDGIADGVDLDSDSYDSNGDGDCTDPGEFGDCVPDVNDPFPYDPLEWNDNDGDGAGDNFDVDDDNDGYLDVHETNTGDFVSNTDMGTDPLVSNVGINSDGDAAFIDPDSECVDNLGIIDGGILSGLEIYIDDELEINNWLVSDANDPLDDDQDGDGIKDFEEVREKIFENELYSNEVYSCGAGTNHKSHNLLLQGGYPDCQDMRYKQGAVEEFRTNNVMALFNGSNTTVGECGNAGFWSSSSAPSSGSPAVIIWDLETVHKKNQLLAGVRFQSHNDSSHYNFPKEVTFKVSETGLSDAAEWVDIGQGAFLPPNAEGMWGNWLPVPDYDRKHRFLRIEITSQYERGSSGSLSSLPVRIAEAELLVEEDNDQDGYSDSVEAANSSDPDLAGSIPTDTDGDYVPDATDLDDDNDGLSDIGDPDSLDITNPDYWAYTFYGDVSGDKLGTVVSDAGDVNGDGHSDLVVGVKASVNGTLSGTARVYNGVTGAILYDFHGDSAIDHAYAVSGAGDVNADGYDDIVVGAYQDDNTFTDSGSAKVYSGANGAVLYTFNGAAANDFLGYSVSGAGDVNADGYDEIVVGAYQHDTGGANSGRVYVYSGVDGSTLHTVDGSLYDEFGRFVSDAGDVNGDGYADFAASSVKDDTGGPDKGATKVYSGADGSLLHTFIGDGCSNQYCYPLDSAGDVNGDGYDDLIVGSWLHDSDGFSNNGRAWVYSGLDGAVLHRFDGDKAGDYLGFSVDGAGDVNGDGYDDLIIGAYGYDAAGGKSGMARIYSGLNGDVLYTLTGDNANDWFGYSVSTLGDVDNNGYSDVAIGAIYDDNNGSNSGSVRLFEGSLNFLDDDGDGVPNWQE